MRYISRSGYETYTACERKYYYSQLWGRGGLDKPIPEEYFVIGIALHAGMEHISRSIWAAERLAPLGPTDIRNVVFAEVSGALRSINASWQQEMARAYALAMEPEPDERQLFLLDEYLHLARGMFLGWIRTQALSFFSAWEPLIVEEEIPLELSSGLVLDTRSDLIARSRETGNLFVFNWKTFGTRSGLFESYNRSIQMWTEALAVQRHLKEPVAGTIIVGFAKGTKKERHYSSPFLWGYNREDLWSATYQRARGWSKIPMWKQGYELPNGDWGQPAWIDWLPVELLDKQYEILPPIPINEGAVETWLPQVIQRETDLEHMLDAPEEDRLRYFFQRFGKQCNWCAFDPICQGLTSPDAMLSDGVLVPREDHHARKEEDTDAE